MRHEPWLWGGVRAGVGPQRGSSRGRDLSKDFDFGVHVNSPRRSPVTQRRRHESTSIQLGGRPVGTPTELYPTAGNRICGSLSQTTAESKKFTGLLTCRPITGSLVLFRLITRGLLG